MARKAFNLGKNMSQGIKFKYDKNGIEVWFYKGLYFYRRGKYDWTRKIDNTPVVQGFELYLESIRDEYIAKGLKWVKGVTPHSFDVDPVLMERLRDRYIENHLTWETIL